MIYVLKDINNNNTSLPYTAYDDRTSRHSFYSETVIECLEELQSDSMYGVEKKTASVNLLIQSQLAYGIIIEIIAQSEDFESFIETFPELFI